MARRNIGNGLAHRHATGSSPVQQRHGGPLTHCHGLTGQCLVIRHAHRHVRHRHLPRTDHLVAHDHACHRPVTDGNQEGLVGYGRQSQHTVDGIAHVNTGCHKRLMCNRHPLHITQHLRRLAEQQAHRQIDGRVVKVAVAQYQLLLFSGAAEHGIRTTLALAQCGKILHACLVDRQHITFL